MRNLMMAALGAVFLVSGCGGDDGGPTPSSCLAPFTSYAGDGDLMGCAGLSVNSTPDGALVTLDGRALPGTTSAAADWLVPEGPYTVEVTLAGYETYTQEVYATGFVTRVNATLVPTAAAMGTLDVSIPPGITGATLLLDGTAVGTMPMAPLEVAEGSHRVTVMADGYVAAEPTVDVRRGETTMVTVAVGRDLTGSWTCDNPIDGRTTRSVTMSAISSIFVEARGFGSIVLLVSADMITSGDSRVTVTGNVNTDGREVQYDAVGAVSFHTVCTR